MVPEPQLHQRSKSPFFRPSSNHRVVVVQQRTPGGTRRVVAKDESDHQEVKSGLLGTASNLINAIVGCGIVGIPYAVRLSGFAAGIFLILFVAMVTEKSLRLLIFTAKHVHV
jgi:sodium-coupled neutral amino acid transporter 11